MTSVLDEFRPGTHAPLSQTELGQSMELPLMRIKGEREQREAVRFAQEVLDDLLQRGVIGWNLDGTTAIYGSTACRPGI